jgi:hypothetical protein
MPKRKSIFDRFAKINKTPEKTERQVDPLWRRLSLRSETTHIVLEYNGKGKLVQIHQFGNEKAAFNASSFIAKGKNKAFIRNKYGEVAQVF